MNHNLKNILPKSWEVERLGEFVITEKGKKPKNISDEYSDICHLPYVNIKVFEKNIIDEYTDGLGCVLCEEGDFVMVWDGSRSGYVGKAIKGALGSTLVRIKFPGIYLDYAYYFLQSKYLEINTRAKGVGIPHVDPALLWNYHFPVPPLREQDRIVAKIEELSSKLDKGLEALKTAQQQLKVYRQAVLKWAFEGRLTNKNVVDGKLPEGWKWVEIGYFLSGSEKGISTGPFGTMLKKSEHQYNGVPVLGIENIGEGVFQMPNKIFVTEEKAKELNSFRVKANDIIISRSGTVGEICLVPEKMEGSIISTNLIKVSINQKVMNPKYFVYLFQGGKVRCQVFSLCKGSSRAFLNQTILKSLDFPYCSLSEQNAIVSEIETRLSVADKLEETITQSLQQAEALRQSILKKAFAGKLVPQDPKDEPASKLLERIKAEKAVQTPVQKTRKKKATL